MPVKHIKVQIANRPGRDPRVLITLWRQDGKIHRVSDIDLGDRKLGDLVLEKIKDDGEEEKAGN